MRTAHLIAGVLALWLCIESVAACEGCGCRGGPGYRGPDGHCVGWAKLNKVCGTPPTTRCAYEGLAAALAVIPALNGASTTPLTQNGISPQPKSLPEAAPVTSNVQQAKADGLGCVDQVTLQQASNCPATKPADERERERANLVSTGACFAIAGGTPAAIEASSRSFDWLRVRVPGTIQSLWTARSLFMQN
jgi:hypothetical protein